MPNAGDAYLNGDIPIANNPLNRITQQPPSLTNDVQAFIQMWTDFFNNTALPILEGIIGVPLTVLKTLWDLFQNLVDAIVGGLGGSGIGNPIELVQGLVANLTSAVQAAGKAASDAAQFAGQALNSVIQIVSSATAPIYNLGVDIINGFVFWFLGLFGLTTGNQQTGSSNTGQIDSIWAHLNPATASCRYVFDSTVPLTDPYPGTVASNPPTGNPSWTPPTGFSLPTVVAGQNYVDDTTIHIGVFTGNPQNSLTDHGLITDRFHIEGILHVGGSGKCGLLCAGDGVAGLANHVRLELDMQSFGSTLSIFTLTGANSGWTQRTFAQTPYAVPTLKTGDVLAIEHDSNIWTMFVNGSAVGTPWNDSTHIVTHGAGFRECGILSNVGGFGTGGGPALGGFNAYDF